MQECFRTQVDAGCINLGGFLRSSEAGFSSCLNLGGVLGGKSQPAASTWEKESQTFLHQPGKVS